MSHLKYSLSSVFRSPKYVIISLLTTLLVIILSTAAGNFGFLWYALMDQPLRFPAILLSTIGSLGTNFTAISATTTVIVAMLFGLNVSFFLYAIKTKRKMAGVKSSGSGLIAGAFGIGCASCGAFLLTGILSVFGAGGLIILLPFKGSEFSLIAIALLMWSTWSLSKSINSSCKLK